MDADDLEHEVWNAIDDGIWDDRIDECIVKVDHAMRWREQHQGTEHPDLIWPLSLKIELLRRRYSEEDASEAAEIAEQRLLLRRIALRDAPYELIQSLRELSELYTFENEPFDPERMRTLLEEAAKLEAASGVRDGR